MTRGTGDRESREYHLFNLFNYLKVKHDDSKTIYFTFHDRWLFYDWRV